ncbi:hypothetical protein GCM10009836_24320 [Pseudonocardia ailaonensis]|uniref:Major facilitator superfamily (MFS) profile domain-containing protein n=1 Tax=Pseudonocardia ailaonensis TaxID=367279 RepID=A0ABN2MZP3_9PSEU
MADQAKMSQKRQLVAANFGQALKFLDWTIFGVFARSAELQCLKPPAGGVYRQLRARAQHRHPARQDGRAVPHPQRWSRHQLVVAFSAAIFGGIASYLNTWLSSRGSASVFTWYAIGMYVLTFLLILASKEIRGIALDKAGVTSGTEPDADEASKRLVR